MPKFYCSINGYDVYRISARYLLISKWGDWDYIQKPFSSLEEIADYTNSQAVEEACNSGVKLVAS